MSTLFRDDRGASDPDQAGASEPPGRLAFENEFRELAGRDDNVLRVSPAP